MDDSIKYWFGGLENALGKMTDGERQNFFHSCGCNCVEQGVLPVYRKVYEQSHDLDTFFERLNDFDGVRGEVAESHRKYCLYFEHCVCPLHRGGYISSPVMCECSRQSIMHVMQTLEPEKKFEVEICTTVLRGNKECKMEITVV